MVTEIDIFAIKQRIVTILKADTGLFDATGTEGKLRKILTGYIDATQTSLTPLATIAPP